MGIQSIAMPALGCGLGGLKWSEVQPLIVKHLGALPDLDV
jgi:O-acetyl-ADP-ribose deacetylase (regulator of RNase III)